MKKAMVMLVLTLLVMSEALAYGGSSGFFNMLPRAREVGKFNQFAFRVGVNDVDITCNSNHKMSKEWVEGNTDYYIAVCDKNELLKHIYVDVDNKIYFSSIMEIWLLPKPEWFSTWKKIKYEGENYEIVSRFATRMREPDLLRLDGMKIKVQLQVGEDYTFFTKSADGIEKITPVNLGNGIYEFDVEPHTSYLITV